MGPTEKSGEQYVYSSPPTVPGERTPDILVRFQAVSRERPCVRQSSVYLSSRSSLLQVRKIIHRTFAPCFEKGFIFLRRNKEVLRSQERIIRLFDILPRPPTNVRNSVFKYPNVQYKRLSYDKSGRRYTSLCCGLVFLCEDSGLSHWIPDTLTMELSAPTLVGFDFVPSSITSARPQLDEVSVDAINELAATGKLQELSTLLKSLPDDLESRHIKDSRCSSPLHYAAQNGHMEVCELLIGRFGREMLYMKDINKQTPLHCALTYGKFEDSGFEKRMENEDGRLTSKLDVVSFLLQLGPDLYSQDIHGINCYRILFTLGNKALDELLHRTDLSLLDDRFILHLTCYVLQYKKMEYAKELCKIVKVYDPKFYRPPLHLAAEIGDRELIELLVNRSVIKNDPQDEEQAREEGESELKQKKPEEHDPRDKDLDGHLPFHYACQHGRDSVLSLLYYDEMSNEDFIKGIFLAVKWKKTTVLQTIVKLRDLFFLDDKTKHMIVQVIENNLTKHSQYARSLMPLLNSEKMVLIRFVSQACRLGDLDALKLIADMGADLQQADIMGRTPLHEAAEAGKNECIKYLLERNVDPNVRDWRGSTPLHYSCIAGRKESVDILLQNTTVVSNVQDKCGRTPLLAAAHSRQKQLVEFLITNYASAIDVHAADIDGRSILHHLYLMDVDTAVTLLEVFRSSEKVLASTPKDIVSPSFVTMCQIWRDQGLELKEKRHKVRTWSMKCARMRCKQCGKVWTILGNRVRLRHVCKPEDSNEEEASENTSSKHRRKKTLLSKPDSCEEIATIPGPFQPFEKHGHQKKASPIDVLLLEDRSDILKCVLDTHPDLLNIQEVHLLHKAAFRWSVRCMGVLVSHLNPSVDELTKVLHATCLQKATSEDDVKKQLEAVQYLLKEGAFPNHMPKKGELEILEEVSFERDTLYYCPLELAVIHGNKELAQLLLKEGASSSICFAPHFAILNGDHVTLGHLLKERTEEDESIIGVIENVDEHWRVCSLGMGLLQALCASEKISMKLLQVVVTLAPNTLQSKKILTKNMVSEIRPDLDVLSLQCPLGRILVKNSLPLSWPLKKTSHNVDLESVILELVQKGVYLDEVRVSKKSTIHAACDLFKSALANKYWKLCEEILHQGGAILWKCILCKQHSCHKHTYKEDIGDTSDVKTFPILFESWWLMLNQAPLLTLKKFFQEGKTFIESSDHEQLKRKINPLLKDTPQKEQLKQEHILTQVVSHHVSIWAIKLQEPLTSRSNFALPLVRLLILFPKLISQILELISPPSIQDSWISKVPRSEFADTFRTYKKWFRTMKALRNLTADRQILFQFAKLGRQEYRSVTKSGDSLLHFVCLLDDVELVKAALDAVDPLDVNTVDSEGASPLDYAVAMGNETTVAYLLKNGACVTQLTLLASCVATNLIPYMKWRYSCPLKTTQEDLRLRILRDLSQCLQFDASYNHPTYGNLLNVTIQAGHWLIVEHLLLHGNNITVAPFSESSTVVPLFKRAPSKVLNVLFEKHKEALKFHSVDLAQEVLFASSTRSKDSAALTLLKCLLEDVMETNSRESSLKCFNLLSWHNNHGMTVIHNGAQRGNFDLLNFVLNVLGQYGYSDVEHVLNVKDETKFTPVWYALANSHWKTARLILLHGGQLPEKRAVPDLSPRRMFTYIDTESKEYPIRSFQDTQVKRNESTKTAECISPKSKTFKEAYVKSAKRLPKKSRKSSNYVPKAIPYEKEKKAIQYLICLSQYCKSTSSRMIHAAAAVGDVDLLQEICAMPMVASLLESNDFPSPLDFALANHQLKTFEILIRKMPMISTITFNHLSLAMLEASGFEMEVKKRKKKKIKLNTEDNALMNLLDHLKSNEAVFANFHKLKNFFLGEASKLDEESISLVLKLLLNNHKGPLNEDLVISLAYLGKLGPLQVLEKCDSEELKTLLTKNLLSGFSFVDLLFLFTKQFGNGESLDITKRASMLEYLSKWIDIKLVDETFECSMRRHLLPMLIPAFEDLVRKGRSQESTGNWMEAFYHSSKQGALDFVKTFVEIGNQQVLPELSLGICKAACLACLHKRRETVAYLLQKDLNMKQDVPNLTMLNRGNWILDFAVLGGRDDIVQDVLTKLDESGVIDSFALRGTVELAAEHGTEPILKTLMQSRMITSVITKDFLEILLLKAAARGHEAVCLTLLKSRYLDVRRTDEHDNSCLHYACLWNMMDLALVVLKESRDELRLKNKVSYNPLDLARCMGNVKISNLLVETHKATPSHEFSLLYTGWLRHLLTKSESESQEYRDIMPRHSLKRRYKFSLLTMLKSSDDLGSLALIETANETLVELMKTSYDKLQFIFLCAKYGCCESLKAIISLIKQFAPEKFEEWINASDKPPLVIALERKESKCAEILIAEGKCFNWTSNVEENILHVAARNGSESLTEQIASGAPADLFTAKDKAGLVPAATAISFGYHHLLRFLYVDGLFNEEEHYQHHGKMNYACVLCLMDLAIGWSKIFQGTFNRHASNSDICNRKPLNANREQNADWSILSDLYAWSHLSTAPLFAALSTMGYREDIVNAQIVLLKTSEDMIEESLKSCFTEAACFLYENNEEESEEDVHQLCLYAAQSGQNQFIKTVLQTKSYNELMSDGNPSILEVALAYGNTELFFDLQKMDVQDSFDTLREILPEALPTLTKWSTGLSHPGDEEWESSMIDTSSKMSLADVMLSSASDDYKNISERNASLPTMVPKTYLGKELTVDIASFEESASTFSNVRARALVMSKLVVGRYDTIIDLESAAWRSLSKINVVCIPKDSLDKPEVILKDGLLRDKVKIRTAESGKGYQVTTGAIPSSLTEEAALRRHIEETVREDLKELVKQEIPGLDINIVIDWDSLKLLKDKESMLTVLKVLSGDISSNRLAGLEGAILKCGSILRDIEFLCGKKASSASKKLLSNCSEIVVKYAPGLPIMKSNALIPKESSLAWHFTLKDAGLHYNTDHFAPLKILHLCHVGYSSFHQAFVRMMSKPNESEPTLKMLNRHRLRYQTVTATIEWDSFDSIGMSGKLDIFIRKHAVPELQKIVSMYESMPWLHLDIDDVCLRVTRMKDRSGLWFKKRTLVVSLRVNQTESGEWVTEDVDCSKFFMLQEEKQILERVPPITYDYPQNRKDVVWPKSSNGASLTSWEKIVKATDNLQNHLGTPFLIKKNDTEWLKVIHKDDFKEMSHPLHLMGRYMDRLAYETWFTFSNTVLKAVETSRSCVYMGTFEVPAGAWSWTIPEDVKEMRDSKLILVMLKKPEKPQNSFQTMKVSGLKDIGHANVKGIWKHVSFNKLLTVDKPTRRIQLASINHHLMFICDVAAFMRLLRIIPNSVDLKPRRDDFKKATVNDRQLAICSNDLATYDGYFDRKQLVCPKKELLQAAVSSTANNISVVWEVWNTSMRLGTNIMIDIDEFDDDQSLELVGYVMILTLHEIETHHKLLENYGDAVITAFNDIDMIRVGFQHSEKGEDRIEKVEGSKYSDLADISLLPGAVLRINFKDSILDEDRELKPITETLISAICCSFEIQTPFLMTETLFDNLNNNMMPENVSVFSFHKRKDKEAVLSAAVRSRNNFFKALKAIREKSEESERHMNAKEKLSEVSKLQFKDRCYQDGSVVGYNNGDMKYWVFKSDGAVASSEEIEEDLLNALEGKDSNQRDRYTTSYNGYSLPLLQTEDLFPDNESVLTVSSPSKMKRNTPRVDRLRRPHATSRLAIQKANERLFDFVEIGHTGNIDNVLDVGANINAKDEEGRTPLIRAAELRNYVLQRMLLSRGADACKSDKIGRTALHLEAAHGDVESLKLLLTHGAKVNAKDWNGRTPLHYSVNRKQVEAVDILVFCGADVTIKDKLGHTPAYQSRSLELNRLMQESRQTVFGIKNGYVFIEHAKLEAESTYYLKTLGLTIKTPPSIGTGTVNFISRRVRPEYSRSSLAPINKELLLSDVFEYRLSGTRPEGHVTMKIPVYAKPDLFEEAYMKTDKGVYSGVIRDFRFEEDKKEWFCYVKMNISNINAFLLVTLPKVEKFPITPEGGVFTSNVDSLVEIRVQRNTFSKLGTLTLEVIPKPAFDEPEFNPVLSLSHFYDMNHTKGEQPSQDVEFTMPIPQDYFGDGDLFVMLRHEEEDVMEEERWEILEKNPQIRNGLITVGVPHFSDVNVIEYAVPNQDEPVKEEDVIRTNAKLLEKAKRRECSVVFMAMLRPAEDSKFEAMVECTKNTRLHNRLHHWKTEGYKDQNPSYTNEFITFPKQEFNFDIGGNSQKVNNVTTKLQYHPKRDNFLKFPICVKDETEVKVGSVDIGEKERLEREFAEHPNYSSLARILVYLAEGEWKKTEVNGEALDPQQLEEAKAFEGFTDKVLLQMLAAGMGPEWMKIGILLGFPRTSLEKLKADEDLEEEEKRLKVLTRWRDRRLHRSDHGVPELLIVLQKCGRTDLVSLVITELKKWLDDKTERKDKFYSWLERALTATTPQIAGLLEPMSDDFLQALVTETGVVFDLAGEIDVSKPEVLDIQADPLAPTDQAKMLKILQTCREKQESRDVSFRVLTEGLTSHGMILARNWMLRTAREWLNNTELSDDPFVHAINDYLEEAEMAYLKKSRDNKDEDNRNVDISDISDEDN